MTSCMVTYILYVISLDKLSVIGFKDDLFHYITDIVEVQLHYLLLKLRKLFLSIKKVGKIIKNHQKKQSEGVCFC